MTENQIQVIITGIIGDGTLTNPQSKNGGSSYQTSCKYLEYIQYKEKLLLPISSNIYYLKENGYCKTPIHLLKTQENSEIRQFKQLSLEEILDQLTELGIALWFYDDSSLHKSKFFYNLCTHAFTKEEHEKYLIPILNKFNIFPVLAKEVKQDGRIFYYLRINKYKGAYEVYKILNKYKLNCFLYKLWSPEIVEEWINK